MLIFLLSKVLILLKGAIPENAKGEEDSSPQPVEKGHLSVVFGMRYNGVG